MATFALLRTCSRGEALIFFLSFFLCGMGNIVLHLMCSVVCLLFIKCENDPCQSFSAFKPASLSVKLKETRWLGWNLNGIRPWTRFVEPPQVNLLQEDFLLSFGLHLVFRNHSLIQPHEPYFVAVLSTHSNTYIYVLITISHESDFWGVALAV